MSTREHGRTRLQAWLIGGALALAIGAGAAQVRADGGAGSDEAEPARQGSWIDRLKATLLRSENGNVERGNAQMAAGEHEAALESYNAAARELPAEGGVHLNRGLALLANGDLPAAREALALGSHPPASTSVRADAYYDLGLAFYREADQLAGSEDHEGAQKLFQEAVDAFKSSLRLRPGDARTAWNYELAKRRLQEQQQKQQEQEQQQQDQDQQDQDQQDQDQQDQDQQGDQDQQQQDQDQQNQDQQGDQDQQQQDQDQQGEQEQPQQPEDEPQDQPQQPQDQQGDQDQQQQQPQEALPRDVEQALDALQNGEENLERMKARQRARRERRSPEKDW